MNEFSPSDILIDPQVADPIIQQPAQISFTQPTNQVESLSGSLLPSLVAFLYVAAVFFSIGNWFGRRQKRGNKLTAIRLRQIQTLERIWQMTAERKD